MHHHTQHAYTSIHLPPPLEKAKTMAYLYSSLYIVTNVIQLEFAFEGTQGLDPSHILHTMFRLL